jgi:hypothetical protein
LGRKVKTFYPQLFSCSTGFEIILIKRDFYSVPYDDSRTVELVLLGFFIEGSFLPALLIEKYKRASDFSIYELQL